MATKSRAIGIAEGIVFYATNRRSVKEAHREVVELYGPTWLILSVPESFEEFGKTKDTPSIIAQMIPMRFALPETLGALDMIQNLKPSHVCVIVQSTVTGESYAFFVSIYRTHKPGIGRLRCAVDIHTVKEPMRMYCTGCEMTFTDKLPKCSICNITRYCSVDCQRAHRPTHKPICTSMMEIRTSLS